MNILLVEDDLGLSHALRKILEDNGYSVDVVHDGQAGLDYGMSDLYDVIILDVMLPKKDGFVVTRELRRARVSTPILLLTARGAVSDKISGYDSGADDFMTKPFSPNELMAHLRALTRRQGDVLFESVSVGDLTLDLESRELSCRSKSIALTAKEFLVCRMLMARRGQLISKEMLLSKVWGTEPDVSDNIVESYISFLRKKLAHLDSTARIETVRFAGYRLMAGEAEEAAGDAGAEEATGTAEGAGDAGAAGDADSLAKGGLAC